MDIDKPLDELMPAKRRGGGGGGRGGVGDGGAERKPRQSRDRRDAVPYSRPPPRSTEEKWVHDAYEGPGRDRRASGGGDRRERRAPPTEAFVGASPRIQVSGLHYEVTPADLKDIFSQAGTIVQGPSIAYDRSGRSTGTATIEYASAQQAKLAINKFDGAMTKGQTIAIKLIAPPRPANKARTDSSSSLLSRIQGNSLQDRIGGERGAPRRSERNERNDRNDRAPRAERGGGGGARGGRGRGNARPRPERKQPATADDLDKELDGFMDKSGDVVME